MGRLNTENEHRATISWAKNYKSKSPVIKPLTIASILSEFGDDLRHYFALAALSRSKSAKSDNVDVAMNCVFRIRVKLETAISKSINLSTSSTILPLGLFSGNFYGLSKKQGVSIRFALAGCQPTSLCKAACYAHDALDASPYAVIRGAINHSIASLYQSHQNFRDAILKELDRHTSRAVKASISECTQDPVGWTRDPRIRFAHVGEAAKYPHFCNALADRIKTISDGKVSCIVYTRHADASLLDPDLFIINFTLDASSEARRDWVPRQARIVYSAFGGETSEAASVNFLEHHRWSHASPKGGGLVCPVTNPESTERTCDAAKCDLCFRRP